MNPSHTNENIESQIDVILGAIKNVLTIYFSVDQTGACKANEKVPGCLISISIKLDKDQIKLPNPMKNIGIIDPYMHRGKLLNLWDLLLSRPSGPQSAEALAFELGLTPGTVKIYTVKLRKIIQKCGHRGILKNVRNQGYYLDHKKLSIFMNDRIALRKLSENGLYLKNQDLLNVQS
jgi:hypothetical protein